MSIIILQVLNVEILQQIDLSLFKSYHKSAFLLTHSMWFADNKKFPINLTPWHTSLNPRFLHVSLPRLLHAFFHFPQRRVEVVSTATVPRCPLSPANRNALQLARFLKWHPTRPPHFDPGHLWAAFTFVIAAHDATASIRAGRGLHQEAASSENQRRGSSTGALVDEKISAVQHP